MHAVKFADETSNRRSSQPAKDFLLPFVVTLLGEFGWWQLIKLSLETPLRKIYVNKVQKNSRVSSLRSYAAGVSSPRSLWFAFFVLCVMEGFLCDNFSLQFLSVFTVFSLCLLVSPSVSCWRRTFLHFPRCFHSTFTDLKRTLMTIAERRNFASARDNRRSRKEQISLRSNPYRWSLLFSISGRFCVSVWCVCERPTDRSDRYSFS
jgi:hypothetical protein